MVSAGRDEECAIQPVAGNLEWGRKGSDAVCAAWTRNEEALDPSPSISALDESMENGGITNAYDECCWRPVWALKSLAKVLLIDLTRTLSLSSVFPIQSGHLKQPTRRILSSFVFVHLVPAGTLGATDRQCSRSLSGFEDQCEVGRAEADQCEIKKTERCRLGIYVKGTGVWRMKTTTQTCKLCQRMCDAVKETVFAPFNLGHFGEPVPLTMPEMSHKALILP